MNHIRLKMIAALTAGVMTASAMSYGMQIMALENRVHAAETGLSLGDVDDDGSVTATDAQIVLGAAAEIIAGNASGLTAEQYAASDVDYTQTVTPMDAQYILNYFLQESVLGEAVSWYALTGVQPPADPAQMHLSPDEIEEMINSRDYSVVTPHEAIETSLTGEMAKVFGNMSAPEAYTYLYNRIRTEFYFGSRKGAIGTFEQSGGNDIDQASLLIAVLRYLGYEADYDSAIVELTAEQMTDITATDSAEVAYQIFREQASERKKTVTALRDDTGAVTGVELEHTWVRAKLPSKYVNGDGSDELIEVPLDTSFKKGFRMHISDEIEAVTDESDLEALEQYLQTEDASVMESFVQKMEQTYEERTPEMPAERVFALIPPAEPQIAGEQEIIGSEYLKGRTDQILIKIGGVQAALLNAPEAYGKQLVISYDFDDDYDLFEELLDEVPETIFDITNYYTRLGINIQPTVTLDGKPVGYGESVAIGTEQPLSITVYSGGVPQELKTTNMLSGSMYAITLDMQNISADELYRAAQKYSFEDAKRGFRELYNEKNTGAYLTLIGKRYMTEADMLKANYADIYHIHAERFMSVCVSSFNLHIGKEKISGEIRAEEYGTVGLDVKSDSYTAISLRENAEDREQFYLNAGIYGSYMEGDVIKEATGVQGVSTMHLFDLAKERDIEILKLTKESEAYPEQMEQLKQNGIPQQALEDISAAVESGAEVMIPEQTLTAGTWSGSPYIVASDAGYSFMLSNLTNGGESEEPVNEGTFESIFGGHDDFYEMWYEISMLTSLIVLVLTLASPALTGVAINSAKYIIKLIMAIVSMYLSVNSWYNFEEGNQSTEEKLIGSGKTAGSLILKLMIFLIK